MKYALNNNELMSSLLINNKDNIIKRFTVISDEEKSEIIDFFKSHSNLENKVDWNKMSNAQESLYQDIQNLMAETKKNAEEKKRRKTDIKSLFNATEHYKVLGEDDNYVYVAPLSHEACEFIDSFRCGGQGATWCIGQADNDRYWKYYTIDNNNVFVLMMKKPKSEEYILERLNYSGDIDLDKIYEIEWGEDDIEDMIEKYPNDNKVMFQIDFEGYVTAWEQTDDFPLFEDRSMNDIIKQCGLGFEWSQRLYFDLNDAIMSNIPNHASNYVDDMADYILIHYDDWLNSDCTTGEINDYLSEHFNHRSYKIESEGNPSMLDEVLDGIAIASLDLSRIKFDGHTFEMRNIINRRLRPYYIKDVFDLSFIPNNSVMVDNFLSEMVTGIPQTIVVNPNCTVLIDYINEYNQKNGTDIQIKMKYDYSNQPELDFGE